ncbi:CAMK family protein kinase [Tritrichomonas foetus]|uniref:CAMK family protein kinase n=1 Tax=Tritrichomonas foetus TaxID=1144522 RepID=A0A1J4JJD6_9EUKA|nr:CAMK family protein kinase [Tritrichomonas foetus]|eukprot:OHS98713.1 CAMK family protein kinase [Tritrichomonas foetus]
MIKPSRPRGFILDEKLGSGAFAEVWLAHHESSQKNVAIKVVTKNSVRQSINKRRLENEIMIQSKINHPFIAPLYYSTENFLNYYLIMEYVPCGTLLSHIKSPCFLSNDTARKYFCQLLLAIYYLHNEMHVVHRDIKAENVLIDENDNIRLIDFGFSGDLNDDKSDVTLMKRCGSPSMYFSPMSFQ